jgi:membrane protease YdiL (CAAX protease family)
MTEFSISDVRGKLSLGCALPQSALKNNVPPATMIIFRVQKPHEPDVATRPELIVPWWEIMAVAVPMLGVGIALSAYFALNYPPGAFYLLISDHFLILDGAFKSAILAAFLLYLRLRGWRAADLRIRPGWGATARGLELLLFTYGAFWAVAQFSHFMIWAMGPTPYSFLAALFIPQHRITPPNGIHLALVTMLAGCTLNAFYEEIVYMGYGFNLWAAKYGPRTAVLFSILARLAIHTYQGTEHLLAIGVWATLFSVWYRYHRNLWQLIFAHLLIDVITFSLLKHYYPPT